MPGPVDPRNDTKLKRITEKNEPIRQESTHNKRLFKHYFAQLYNDQILYLGIPLSEHIITNLGKLKNGKPHYDPDEVDIITGCIFKGMVSRREQYRHIAANHFALLTRGLDEMREDHPAFPHIKKHCIDSFFKVKTNNLESVLNAIPLSVLQFAHQYCVDDVSRNFGKNATETKALFSRVLERRTNRMSVGQTNENTSKKTEEPKIQNNQTQIQSNQLKSQENRLRSEDNQEITLLPQEIKLLQKETTTAPRDVKNPSLEPNREKYGGQLVHIHDRPILMLSRSTQPPAPQTGEVVEYRDQRGMLATNSTIHFLTENSRITDFRDLRQKYKFTYEILFKQCVQMLNTNDNHHYLCKNFGENPFDHLLYYTVFHAAMTMYRTSVETRMVATEFLNVFFKECLEGHIFPNTHSILSNYYEVKFLEEMAPLKNKKEPEAILKFILQLGNWSDLDILLTLYFNFSRFCFFGLDQGCYLNEWVRTLDIPSPSDFKILPVKQIAILLERSKPGIKIDWKEKESRLHFVELPLYKNTNENNNNNKDKDKDNNKDNNHRKLNTSSKITTTQTVENEGKIENNNPVERNVHPSTERKFRMAIPPLSRSKRTLSDLRKQNVPYTNMISGPGEHSGTRPKDIGRDKFSTLRMKPLDDSRHTSETGELPQTKERKPKKPFNKNRPEEHGTSDDE